MTLYLVAGIILAVGGFLLWLYLAGRSAGKDGVRADVAVKTVDVQAAQQKAAVNAPEGKSAIIERLRKGGGL